jgi:hypothetical protein
VAQRFALDIGHDVEEETVGGARVVDRHDVGVGEGGRDLDLPQEPLRSQAETRVQDLDRDPAAVSQVPRENHRAHAATADQSLDAIALGEGGTNSLHAIGQWAEPVRDFTS